MTQFEKDIRESLDYEWGIAPDKADTMQLYHAASKAAVKSVRDKWADRPSGKKRACYLSAEFLVGRLVYANLMNLGLLGQVGDFLGANGKLANAFEEIEDAALGNGGLGRLAACYLDSAATHDIPLDGYGIRYKYGLFKQSFDKGFQKETPDDWQRFGDPWSVRREEDAVLVETGGQTVRAVPYDMPVIGYKGAVNNLRLWQAEPVDAFNFDAFNEQDYAKAAKEKNRAEDICALLYPNDDGREGKKLRLRQQYFFSSASMQNIVREYVKNNGADFSKFADSYAVQLNDTHPVVSVPELLRILMADYLLEFGEAFDIALKTFAYTNHTVMPEALEAWDKDLFASVLPEVYPYVVMLQNALRRVLTAKGLALKEQEPYYIVDKKRIHMARLAAFATHSVNGVAAIHTEIIKETVLADWYKLYPERFNNKTNGITQRRWLGLCNPQLGGYITELIGDGWLRNLDELKRLVPIADDSRVLNRFAEIKREKKRELCAYVLAAEGVELSPDFIFDVQVKRLHEYKRQLLNAFSILDIYFGLKDGSLADFAPTAFLFGAKAAPGYYRAKGIIKFINEIAKKVNADTETNDRLKVVFVQNYNVSYAEKLIPAADISEQISTAGTEASGTGNMKFMLNGAVTLGTLDGANIEIVEQAGEENNYIFGKTVEEIEALKLGGYDAMAVYKSSPRVKRVLDTLVDGTLSDGLTGMFKELYDSLLVGASWHKPDNYFLLADFEQYMDAKLRANRDYADGLKFARKCFVNVANAGKFSSDRAVKEYAAEIWGV